MAVTAKVKVSQKREMLSNSYGNSTETSVELCFLPDYGEGKNDEWAKYTPTLNFSLTVKPEVAARFTVGQAFTVTFTPSEAE